MAVEAQLYSENLGFSAYCSSQDWMAINPGSGFGDSFQCSSIQNQPLLSHVYDIQNVGLGRGGGAVSSGALSYHQSMSFSLSLAAEAEKQWREIDLYLRVQNERLRHGIQQQRKQQIAALLNRLEPKASALLRQKEQDLAKVRKKTEQLEECLRRAEIETEAWQRAAKENEAMVISLNNMLEHLKDRLYSGRIAEGAAAAAQGGAESVCESSSNSRISGEREKGVETEGKRKGFCKCCKSRSSCIVFLPCKHLCSCRSCEAFLELCPVCQSVKEGCTEVFLH
ncbi:hypothetical protein Nepgr_005126 [Nepenthes gracilis]|uniref:RING-type domain-containing protein n=1 Tax=Nepenthes gracilis TaxID=150966 RepID=A0AAD3S2W6_NEPGR|nr:hypothetical protein Nepgr_005126 [Nepenthes gracilis]